MWFDKQIDDLSPGDFLEVVCTDGLTTRGYLRVIRWSVGDLVIDSPLEGFDGEEIGASIYDEHVISMREVRSIKRLACESQCE